MPNLITGTSGADALNGLSGDNEIHGGAGDDKLNGGAALDILDGGSGSDTLSGNSGDDLLVYRQSDNAAGARDSYDGGAGKDTLLLTLTLEQWKAAAFQGDLAALLTFIDVNTHWRTLEANNAIFNFAAFGLASSKFEQVRVLVGGVELSPENNTVVTQADAMSASESTPGLSGNLLANDSIPDQAASVLSTNGAHGTVSLQTDLSQVNAPVATATYTPDAAFYDHLAAGATATDSFTYTVTDANGDTHTSTVTVTITGENDAASISGTNTGSVGEDGTTASGQLTVADVDDGEAKAQVAAAGSATANGLGTYQVDATGLWTFTVDNAKAQHLAAGANATDTFVVQSHDGTDSETVTVTIVGANDAASISGANTGSVGEDGTTASGQLTVSDVDDGEAKAQVAAAGSATANGLGTYQVDAAGLWTFTVDNAKAQHLAAGANATDTFVVQSHDGTDSETVTVTIVGANDAAAITGTKSGSVTEDGVLTASGTLVVADPDDGQARFQAPTSLAGSHGVFAFDPDTGAWSYALNNGSAAVQALNTGQSLTDTLVVRSLDESVSETITVTINGQTEPVGAAPNSVKFALNPTPQQSGNDGLSNGGVIGAFTGGDPDTPTSGLTYALAGPQASLFSIGAATGVLTSGGSGGTPGANTISSLSVVVSDGVSSTSFAFQVYVGSSGDNAVVGGSGIDIGFGQQGGDTLTGSGGDDALIGGVGNDVLVGGAGWDQMLGGGGRDVFRFGSAADSGATASSADVIFDFGQGGGQQDTIDLAAIKGVGGINLAFGTNQAGVAPVLAANKVIAWQNGGDTYVMVDTNGNTANAEMVIKLVGPYTLGAGDFLFA